MVATPSTSTCIPLPNVPTATTADGITSSQRCCVCAATDPVIWKKRDALGRQVPVRILERDCACAVVHKNEIRRRIVQLKVKAGLNVNIYTAIYSSSISQDWVICFGCKHTLDVRCQRLTGQWARYHGYVSSVGVAEFASGGNVSGVRSHLRPQQCTRIA